MTQALKETKSGGAWTQAEKWDYTWNVRDQLIRAVKYTTGANNVGSVEYEYCLSCDGALSKRFQFAAGTGANPGALQTGRRYEYDGLNLLRVDELYDSNSNGLTEDDAWRRLEVNTHGLGTLGALIGKRVYTHTNNDSTPDATNDYTYTYDAVGNVIAIYNANSTNRGNELYYFSQDAFGNELSNDGNLPTWQRVNLLGGTQWGTARTAGITEHQTGKWNDSFTGLYYFHGRWLDAGVGRFVGRDKDTLRPYTNRSYMFTENLPIEFVDLDGLSSMRANGIRDQIGPGHLQVQSWCNKKQCDCVLKVKPEGPSTLISVTPGKLMDVDGVYQRHGILKIPDGVDCTLTCDRWLGTPRDVSNCLGTFWNVAEWVRSYPPGVKPGKDGEWPDNPFTRITEIAEEDIPGGI